MIIINLKGGLGNQMFQYAFGKYLAGLFCQELLLNNDIYVKGISNRDYDLDIFQLSDHHPAVAETVYEHLKDVSEPIVHLNERYFHYDPEIIDVLQRQAQSNGQRDKFHLIVSGYWQSYRYLQGMEEVLLKDFTFRNPLHGRWKQLGEEIAQRQSVMINVRRGDYLEKLDHHGVVSREYLLNAMELMKKDHSDLFFYVFSDDIPWCRENLADEEHVFFVDESYYDAKYQYYLQLMLMCKHFILANSSFAWWSAWLSRSKDKLVIAPKNWFTYQGHNTDDLLPPGSIRI